MHLRPETLAQINDIATRTRNYTTAFAAGYFALATEASFSGFLVRDCLELGAAACIAQGIKEATTQYLDD